MLLVPKILVRSGCCRSFRLCLCRLLIQKTADFFDSICIITLNCINITALAAFFLDLRPLRFIPLNLEVVTLQYLMYFLHHVQYLNAKSSPRLLNLVSQAIIILIDFKVSITSIILRIVLRYC